MMLNSDEADVGYGGVLYFDKRQVQRGLWEGRGFWNVEDKKQSITLRELRAVPLLLNGHFADYVSDHQTRLLPLHENNQEVDYILRLLTQFLGRFIVPVMLVVGLTREVRGMCAPSAL